MVASLPRSRSSSSNKLLLLPNFGQLKGGRCPQSRTMAIVGQVVSRLPSASWWRGRLLTNDLIPWLPPHTKHQVQDVKYQTANTKYKISDTKQQTPSTKYTMPESVDILELKLLAAWFFIQNQPELLGLLWCQRKYLSWSSNFYALKFSYLFTTGWKLYERILLNPTSFERQDKLNVSACWALKLCDWWWLFLRLSSP